MASYGLNLLATPYVVSQLGLQAFGIWAMTGAMAQYAALLDMGAARAALRFVALFHARGETEKDRAAVGICVTLALGLGTVLGLIAFFGADLAQTVLHTGDSALTRFLLLCSVCILTCGLVARVLAAASFGRGRQLPPNVGLALLGASQLVGGVIALAVEGTLRSFAVGTASGAVVGLCVVAIVIYRDEGRITIGRPRIDLAKEIVVFGVHSQVAGAADVVLYQSGKLIAGIVIGPAAAGAYELGIRLIQGVQAFGGAVSVAINTHLTRAYATAGMDGIREQFSRLTRRNAAVAIFLPFLLGATAVSAVPLWLGGGHTSAVIVASALAFGISVNVAAGVCAATLYAIGRPDLAGLEGVVYAVVSVVLAVPCAIFFGFNGLVAAYACWIPLGNLFGVWFLQSRVGISLKTFARAVAGPFGLALLATAVALPINLVAAPDSRADAIAPFLASSVVFCVVYIALGTKLDYLPRLPVQAFVMRIRGNAPSAEISMPASEIGLASNLVADAPRHEAGR
ncbi:polysaccharide biosynthesis C-terminal domain-containing protein [Candidatus Mycolicibacterium alkanivorans]|uniref:Polysaccharide biosynthesis C-terminal domain-containing protein n=1 Tax=Candidatus Mycolicibacterium alkanivorans TaxID=2954114 RepID=A0ABS9YXD8_9MYCO|nr:polysaccharide biosynthesis C-terminal domain-containing protein [Candidatus Mycolicibacterium alkanivorans]MCI4675912.1 polysaccharide biosynthesis C-terminal domain-containing protein [Candidatus Mycolicibacterium alkanivorans]